MITSNPAGFAKWFNEKYAGAYRQITTEDVKDLTDCGLIHRRNYYSGLEDGETVRGILRYEQLRENRPIKQDKEKQPPFCKRCGQPLPTNTSGKLGRHNEYCSECESFRNKERQRHFRNHQTN